MKKLLLLLFSVFLLTGCATNQTTVSDAPDDNPYFFAYALTNRKGPISYIVVADLEEENVFGRTPDQREYFTIPREKVEAIKDVVVANEALFSFGGIEDLKEREATESIFYFSDGIRSVEIHGLNMDHYTDFTNYPNAKYVVEIFNEIKQILLDEGIDPKYLQLGESTE